MKLSALLDRLLGRKSAYVADATYLKESLAHAQLPMERFQRRVHQCDLNQCKGYCCYDGIYVSDESAGVVSDIVARNREYFESIGLKLPENVIVEGSFHGAYSGKKTATRSRPSARAIPEFPKHFNETACVFMLADGRCSLQTFSVHKGMHPWFYKPIDCWLHPIQITDDGEIDLPDERSEPYQSSDYPGFTCFTGCGRTSVDARRAVDGLKTEIQYLSKVIDRDLLAEVNPILGGIDENR